MDATLPFHFIRKQMEMVGILEYPKLPKYMNIAKTVLAQALVFNLVLAGFLYLILMAEKPFSEKMECALTMVGTTHVFSKILVLPLNRPTLLRIMSSLDEMSLDSWSVEKLRKQTAWNLMLSRRIPETVVMSLILLIIIGTIVAMVKYANSGTVTPPLQFYTPFGDNSFILTTIYSYCLVFAGVCVFAVEVSIFIALTLNISCQMSYLVMKLESLGKRPLPNEIDSCIVLHQKILRVVRDVNVSMSGLIFFEYLLTSLQCCLSGFNVLNDTKNVGNVQFFYHCTFFIISIVFSGVNCYCGNIIKLQILFYLSTSHFYICCSVASYKSEKIFEAAYYNNWYKLNLVDRKKLLAILTVSSTPLTYSYRYLITFDLALYGNILKGAYSLVTMLQTMNDP